MIILNEREYIEDFLKSDKPIERPTYTTATLARYYYHCKGMRGESLINELHTFLDQRYPNYAFNKSIWAEKIEEFVANAKDAPLYEIDGVWITSSELDKIASLNNSILERLAFTLLCLAKLNLKRNPNCNAWVNTSYKEIFKLAHITDSSSKRLDRLRELYRNGFFEMANRLDNLSLRISFVDDESQDVLFVSDFRELAYEYLKYKGENFIRCGECGILVRGNKNGTKLYCPECLRDRIYVPPMEVKAKYCIDCGCLFEVSAKNNQSKRCPHCQDIHKRELNRARKQKQRNSA